MENSGAPVTGKGHKKYTSFPGKLFFFNCKIPSFSPPLRPALFGGAGVSVVCEKRKTSDNALAPGDIILIAETTNS